MSNEQKEANKMKRISKQQKIELIKQKQAYVGKCDNGYFFYSQGRERPLKISKPLFEELEYIEWETEMAFNKNNQ
jgi:hypothetical protein